MRRVIGALAVALLPLLAACGSSSSSHPAVAVAKSATTTPTPEVTDPSGNVCISLDGTGYCPGNDPSPTASPNGTYQGSCDYILGNDPANGTAVATGDIQVSNTGNIGTVVKVTITWPQEGFSPLSETKTVKVAAGASQDVQFNMPLTGTELDNLQNYQSGHSDTGCTYNGTMIDTFGAVHAS